MGRKKTMEGRPQLYRWKVVPVQIGPNGQTRPKGAIVVARKKKDAEQLVFNADIIQQTFKATKIGRARPEDKEFDLWVTVIG